MHKLLLYFFLLICIPLQGWAEKWSVETLPMVHLQDSTRFVCNPDGVLSPEAVSRTDLLLRQLKRDKGVETVVVVVKQLQGDDPYEFGMELSRKYGIGSKKQNSGLIIILATEDRSYQILTGRGLEATLPDAICRRIQNRVMVPQLKRQRWDAAIVQTVEQIDSYVRMDESLRPDKKSQAEEGMNAVVGFFISIIVLGGFLFIFGISNIRKKCPHCRQAQMRLVKKQRVRVANSRDWLIRSTYRCPRCGFEKHELEEEDNDNDTLGAGGMVPPIFFGGFGGRSGGGGGGFGGGLFGGGFFGGGGSGGRF